MKQFVILSCLLLSLGASAQSITMRIGDPQISGSQITYDLSVQDFFDIVAFQYSISYDSSVLSLVAINDILIPSMNITNFDTSAGSIVNVWFDNSLDGVTLADNSILYKMVFEIKTAGDGMVCFSQEPREPEALQGEETLLDIYVIDDCHDTPFLFHDAMTSVVDVYALAGVTVGNISRTGDIAINVQETKPLNFLLTDLQGRVVMRFPEKIYNAGHNVLKSEFSITPGVYLLVLQYQNQLSSTRILFIN